MSRQLPLPLRAPARQRLENFVVGDNQVVLAAVRKLLAAQERQLFLAGPTGAGKSHLLLGACAAAVRDKGTAGYLPLAEWCDRTPDILTGMEQLPILAIDDVDRICGNSRWELALFNLYNRARTVGARILFAATDGPAALTLGLPDLRSRLTWGLTFAVHPMDDHGRCIFLVEEAERRGLALSIEAARYVLTRYSRDVDDLLSLMDRLDQAAMAEQRHLTLPFVIRQLRDGLRTG